MARPPRLTAAGYPHHLIQRGNNRQPIFVDDVDRKRFLALLHEYAQRHHVAIHAYVLMSNHVHLLATPDTQDGVPQLMQAVGRHYVRWFNIRHGRTGSLWEGRYRSSLIEAERHLLACMAYIDLNPVRAGLAARAADYPWSGHAHLIGQRHDGLLTPHPLYWALGNTPFAREQGYANLVATGLDADRRKALGKAAHTGQPIGGAAFMRTLAAHTGHSFAPRPRGRPPRPPESTGKPQIPPA